MLNLTDSAVVRSILAKHGFSFSKNLGQNFIINPDICPEMAENCGADSESGVLEIGPGIGVLTKELCLRAKKVVSIELDKRLLPILDETVGEFDNLKIINADVMKADLKKIITEEFGDMPVYVCANLPYYITSPIIMMLLENNPGVRAITVMVQKEWADRITSPVGSRDAGAVTVAVDYYSQVQKLFGVSKNSFMPAPKVDSAVIRMDIREKPPVEIRDEKLFFAIVKAAFGQRRKTALNSLSSGLAISKDAVAKALTQCGFDTNVRAETMTMEEFAALADALCNSEK
ncbi:MAG: 16S rRNA (adenine(1518)-N(6)/adenine(1519)-N(6))-dimethyltransferase RsmA [Clostridia bacterium]|nr:16S rRNA (adenine(1518)-N(6)/adenine(1519)-N(6))-dimethyltransferase RsmA [Clostridia bacterium]